MTNVNLYEFKSHFSDYARRVKEGETVILCERNVPIAEIRPIAITIRERRREPGLFRIAQIQLAELPPDRNRRVAHQRMLDLAEPTHKTRQRVTGNPVGEEEIQILLHQEAHHGATDSHVHVMRFR